jgi:hypothetical protein
MCGPHFAQMKESGKNKKRNEKERKKSGSAHIKRDFLVQEKFRPSSKVEQKCSLFMFILLYFFPFVCLFDVEGQ